MPLLLAPSRRTAQYGASRRRSQRIRRACLRQARCVEAGPTACVRGGVTRTPARRKRQADPVRPRESSFAAKHLQIAEREQRLSLAVAPGVSRQFVASRWRPATATGRVACAASNRAPRRQCQRPTSRAATIRRSRPAFAAGWRAPRRPAGRPAGHDLPVACWAGGRGDWRLACSNSKAIDALRCDAIADAAVRDVPWCAFLSYFFVFGYYYEDTWLKWRCVRA